MTAIEKLRDISAFFKNAGIEDADREAEVLIIETLHIDKSKLYSIDLEISDQTLKHIDSFAERRAYGEPIQYIIGNVDFYGLRINVGRGVLIPRPETELLVEETIKLLKEIPPHPPLSKGGQGGVKILDLCTGSGCIALALAKHFPDSIVYGIDKSDVAIEHATSNAIENNIKNVHFIKGDLFEPVYPVTPLFPPLLRGGIRGGITVHGFDCIVSNPPYIKTSDIQVLQREIKDYEPLEALDGGEDGLDFYRKILNRAGDYLSERGVIILEIGFEQADDVLLIANKAGFGKVDFIKDYSGIERICIINK